LLLLVELRQDSASQRRGRLFIFPANPVRQPLKGIDESAELSEGLKRAYLSALSVYNHRDWSATAVSCRRVLEGLTKSLLPQELHDLPLASQIEQLPERADLARPILTLARSLKEGGNLGAHFDLDREPNEHVARLMVDLLDDLIEYLFVLPRRIEELNQRIARSGRSATAPPSVGEVGA
jgi:hypothetical protein